MVQKTNVVKHRPSEYRKKKHTGLIVVIVLVVVALIAAGVLLFLNRNKIFQNEADRDKEETSKQEKKEEKSEEKSDEKEEKPSSETREAEKASINQNDGEDPNTLENITGVINFAGISEGDFMVTASLDQALGDAGNCKFTIVHSSGATIVSSAATSAGPTTSFCTYSAPASGMNSGHYSINVEISANGKKGTITGEANI